MDYKTFTLRVLIIISLIIAAFLALFGFYYLIDVLLILFSSILLATFFIELAKLLRTYSKISENISLVTVTLFALTLFIFVLVIIAPNIAEEFGILRQKLPDSVQKVSAYFSQFSWARNIIATLPSFEETISKIDTSEALRSIGGYFSSTLGILSNIILIFLLTLYLTFNSKYYFDGFISFFPIPTRQRAIEVLTKTNLMLSRWLFGTLGSMTFIGLCTWLGLLALGVPLAGTLGLIAGSMSFIPNFGPILSAVPAILLAFVDSPMKALYVAILFIIVQLLESNVITPIIVKKTVDLSPVLTLLAQVALGILLGSIGLILATPLLVVMSVLFQMVYKEGILGDHESDEENVRKTIIPKFRRKMKKSNAKS